MCNLHVEPSHVEPFSQPFFGTWKPLSVELLFGTFIYFRPQSGTLIRIFFWNLYVEPLCESFCRAFVCGSMANLYAYVCHLFWGFFLGDLYLGPCWNLGTFKCATSTWRKFIRNLLRPAAPNHGETLLARPQVF